MKFLDYYYLKKDLRVSANEDPHQDKALENLEIIIATLLALKEEVTPHSITHVISSDVMLGKLTKTVIFEIGTKAIGRKWIDMILSYSSNGQFDFLRFFMTMCGIIRNLMPRVAEFDEVNNKFFMGYNASTLSPNYKDMGLNQSTVIYNHDLCITQNMLLDMIQGKLSNGLGFIYLDGSDNPNRLMHLQHLIQINGLQDQFVIKNDLEFNTIECISQQKIIYVPVKKTKNSILKFKRFSENLLSTLKTCTENKPQYGLITVGLESLLKDEWMELHKTLNNLTMPFNVIHLVEDYKRADKSFTNSADLQIICDNQDLSISKNITKHFGDIPDLENHLASIAPHEYILIENGIHTKYIWTL